MSKSHRRDPGPQFDPDVRELLRRERAAVEFELSLTERESDVRLTLPKIAWEEYERVPDTVEARYLPGERAVVIKLPEPEPTGAIDLTDFE